MNKQILKLYQQGCGVIDTAELLGVSTEKVIETLRGKDVTKQTKVVQDMRQSHVYLRTRSKSKRGPQATSRES